MAFSSTLLALLLTIPDADAGRGFGRAMKTALASTMRVSTVTTDPDAGAVLADITSDAGSETITLVESDAWLHGAAAIKALPTVDATVQLTVYDQDSASLMTYSGTLGADGSVVLAVDGGKLDIAVLAAEVFPNVDGGYDIGFDLSGADTFDIAYADVAITERKTSTKAEVDLDTLGAVWTGTPALDHAGTVELKSRMYDLDGEKLASSKAKLGMPWDDEGEGVNALATDDDPLTSVALSSAGAADGSAITVLSTDWTRTDAPVSATLELEGGETLTVPANSYQIVATTPISFTGSPEREAFQVTIDGTPVKEGSSFTDRGLCTNGTCVALTQATDGTWTLSATAYGTDAVKLPTSVKVGLTSTRKVAAATASSYTLTYEPEVAVLFANEVSLSGDPIDVDLSGKVKLLAAASGRGKQKTLAKGSFYGTLTRDEDGDLALAGVDKDDIVAKGDILIGGEPIDFELTDADKDGVIEAPPAILYHNGKGTRVVATTNTGSPGLL